jgi:hypothetical protein
MKINKFFLMLWIPFSVYAQPSVDDLFSSGESESSESCGLIPMMDPGAGAGMRA